MNFFGYHTDPDSLDHHAYHSEHTPEVIWDENQHNHEVLHKHRDKLATHPVTATNYAIHVLNGRFPEGEKQIAKDGELSRDYAARALGDRFPAGEDEISKDRYTALKYAYFLKNDGIAQRFPKGEKAIAGDASTAYDYAAYILKGRFPEGEKAIRSDPHYSELYDKLLKDNDD